MRLARKGKGLSAIKSSMGQQNSEQEQPEKNKDPSPPLPDKNETLS